jgi:phosphoglycerate dehydrogenase-like enzyme
MAGPGILVLSEDAADYGPLLGDLDATVTLASSAAEAVERYCGQQVVLGQPDEVAAALDRLDGLRWVQSTWAGVTPLLRATRRDYQLTGVKDLFGPQMAEYVFAHLLNHTQGIPGNAARQRARKWNPTAAQTLAGGCMGIMGTGSIGRHVAAVADAFGLEVLGLSRSGRPADGFSAVYPVSQLAEFLPLADFLVGVLPDTPHTTGLLDASAFAKMKPGAVFINVGRGNLVDEAALIEALQSGRLAAAVLDVFITEPLPPGSALWDAPRLTLTPHVAAQSWPADIARIFCDNYRRFVAGSPLMYTIDFSQGY